MKTQQNEIIIGKTAIFLLLAIVSLALGGAIWFAGSANPSTPAGYVGYLTQDSIFGKSRFYGMQTGPTSPGRNWMLHAVNVSVTPYTYTEEFAKQEAVLSKDNLKIEFRVHIVWKLKPEKVQEFIERYSTITTGENPNNIVKVAYANFLQEPIRTFAREEVQQHDALAIKDEISSMGSKLLIKAKELTNNTPYEVNSVVIGNIQYPIEVANAVSEKLAATQVLQRKETEIKQAEADKKKRIVDAEGVAAAMDIINAKLTGSYLQHEAIQAQATMVNSPNHTTIYIPVGNMGIPLVQNIDDKNQRNKEPNP